MSVTDVSTSFAEMNLDESAKSLIVKSLPTPFPSRVDELLPNLLSLTLQTPLPGMDLQELLRAGKSIEVLKVVVGPFQEIQLSWFEQAHKLRQLELTRGEWTNKSYEDAMGVHPFTNPERLSQLTSVSFSGTTLQPGVISALAKLPLLTELRLNASIEGPQTLKPLHSCKQIKRLNLSSIYFSQQPSIREGELFLLQRAMPGASIIPVSCVKDCTDYSGVLLDVKKSPYCYSRNDSLDSSARAMFYNNREHERWSKYLGQLPENRDFVSLYDYDPPNDHNLCPFGFYYAGSPIKRPDGGFWIAAPEPHNNITRGDFWQVVFEHVSLIVMVKKLETPYYFPLTLDKPEIYIGQKKEEVKVTCIKQEPGLDGLVNLRHFLVNGKPVTHIQVNWEDATALNACKLGQVIELVLRFEKMLPPQKTLVHCWAGWGRTGTFIASMLIRLMASKLESGKSPFIDLEYLLTALRQQRKLIQNIEQFECVFEYFKMLMLNLDSAVGNGQER